jgi:hypothetical protein
MGIVGDDVELPELPGPLKVFDILLLHSYLTSFRTYLRVYKKAKVDLFELRAN